MKNFREKTGFAAVALIVVIAFALVLVGVWYFKSQQFTSSGANEQPLSANSTTPSSQPPSSPCQNAIGSTTTLVAYVSQQERISFCYPSYLTVTTDTISWPKLYQPPLFEN